MEAKVTFQPFDLSLPSPPPQPPSLPRDRGTGKGETLRSAQGGHLPKQNGLWARCLICLLGCVCVCVFELFVGVCVCVLIWLCFVLKQFVNISTEHHTFIF